jgi:hypothetical protein
LAAKSAWNPESLFETFLHGLSEQVKDELAAWELLVDLDSLITLTINIDGRLRERKSERRSGLERTRYGAFTSYGIRRLPKAALPRGVEVTRALS